MHEISYLCVSSKKQSGKGTRYCSPITGLRSGQRAGVKKIEKCWSRRNFTTPKKKSHFNRNWQNSREFTQMCMYDDYSGGSFTKTDQKHK